MALTRKQIDALNTLVTNSDGLQFEPTLMPSHYLGLVALDQADPADLLEYGRSQGWTELAVGRLLGAAQLVWLVRFSSFDEWRELLDARADADTH